jgi:hypothetical protein
VTDDRLGRAIAAIDAANAEDPVVIVMAGESRRKELAHAVLVTEWVRRLDPDPSEALLLAARAHHLRRWAIPRASYPAGRAGYLKWRKVLHEKHAADVAEVLAGVGYDAMTIERVQDIVRKRRLGTDPEVQVFEDALCLVFLETQFHDLVHKVDIDKLRDIIEKTARKMSPEALALVPELDIAPDDRARLDQVLSG